MKVLVVKPAEDPVITHGPLSLATITVDGFIVRAAKDPVIIHGL